MTLVESLPRRQSARMAHTEEWFSILLCLGGTVLAVFTIWTAPGFEPAGTPVLWTVPVWMAFLYVLTQLVFLLVSATQIRALGVIDSIVAIAPVIAGAVLGVEWLLGHLALSSFQAMSLLALLVAGLSEFSLTLWIRFVLNRRTFAIDSGAN